MAGIRIGGLASGMDIDTLVSDLMKAERIPLDKLAQKKQTLEWQRDSYREMNKLLQELDDTLFTNKDSIGRESTFLKKTVSSSNDSLVSAKAINSQTNITSTIDVSSLASAQTWKSSGTINYTKQNAELKFKVTDPGSTTSRNVSISIKDTDTLDNVISKINSSGLGVTAMKEKIYDSVSDSYKDTIVLSNNKTGSGAKIEYATGSTQDSTIQFMQHLGFEWDANNPTQLKVDKQGSNAVVKVNGYQMEQTSNTFTINGVEYTAKGITTNSGSVTISSSTDVDGILDSIVKFVDKYNEVIEKINEKTSETRYRDYQPLTDEQKADMEEKTIELWEEKAKSGLLKNDSILNSSLDKMRINLYTPVSNQTLTDGFNQLSDIGITTTSNYLDKGKLTIDEDKLREKIQEDPSAIFKLFNSEGTTDATQGVAKRLRSTIKNTISSVEEKAGNSLRLNSQFTIGKNIISIDEQIDRFEDRLTQIEDRYWRQFTAMEQAISQSNQQSSYLMQQFSM
ncbi:flagellar hook-associated protein 2 [Metabacillus halosaccharovorans]|uniref:Flagellar hook-associated protein 2 n=1 Tax=Metabacillus halosaccharovorans TaxID=930124 RepID=A0ABT3DBN3_9BACI|nr:flagellar hook-associated protein 2 [Metabacillus halosaccharovorans]MCV9884463.1 flagellar hook-associated protein 2 [Metabacillus halosaccharovorans]